MHVDPASAITLSIIAGLAVALLGFPIAVPIGYLLARKHFVGKSVVGALVLAPLVLPPVVTGLLLLRGLGNSTAFGRALHGIGIVIPFSFTGVVLASLVVGLPLYVLTARDAFASVDARLEQVALSLGMKPMRAFWAVTFPLALPGVAAGAVLAFARALGEFGATAVIAGNMEGETRTLALAVYSLLDVPNDGHGLLTLVATSLGIGFVTIVAYESLARWQRRRLGVS